jgi:hypothetical protein
LTSVPVPPRDGHQWRINFSRVQWDLDIVGGKYEKIKGRKEHNWVWSPQGVVDMHRPERWGYLQFSAAKPGTAAFQPDPERHVRELLHRVYYAQRIHWLKTGSYASSLEALKLNANEFPRTLLIHRTRNSFEAEVPLPDNSSCRWVIGQDSWIRKIDPAKSKK